MARISKNQLIKLQRKYRTDDSIGELFGISRQAVHQLRRAYDLNPVPNRNHERDDEMIRLYGNGTTGARLAHKFRLSLSQVFRIIARHNANRPAAVKIRKKNG